jgi:multiple sugar transport system substrate-binding protein
MEFFHRPNEEKYGGCLFRTPGYMVWEWWIRFHAKNHFPVQDDMTPNINNQAGVEALEDLLRATQFQHPSARTNGLFDNWREYAKGHCAVNIGWGGTQKYLNSKTSKMKDRMLFAPTPQISYFNWGWNYVTSKLSAHQEIAYLFSLYATISMPSKIAVQNQTGFFDPFRECHYQDPKIEQSYSKEFLVAHKQAMKTAIPDFYLKGQGKYIQTLRENITSAAEKEISPREALSFTAKQWEMITQEEGRDGQIEQWLFLKKQYPKHLNLK